MDMRKKILALFLVVCLCILPLSACSNSSSTSSKGKTKDGKVQLTAIFLAHPLTKDINKIKWLKEAEDKAGVTIKWEQISSDWDQKKGALLASGDIPDLIIGPNAVTDADYAKFTGEFADMSPLIKKDAPNVEKMFTEHPETKTMATQSNGAVYGLPKYQRFWPKTSTRMYINKQWLDKLGLKEPKTWDQLFNVLEAFKKQDANGDGNPNDEIPMDFAPIGTTGFGFFEPTVLLGSMGMTISGGGGQGYYMDNGKVKSFLTDPRYKELIEFLNKCWKAGLINKETFTQDYTKFQSVARGKGDTAKVGFTFGWVASDRFGSQLASQYESLPQLKVDSSYTGKLSYSYDYNALNYGTNMVSLSAKSQNKDAAMRFINQLYDPKVSMQVLFGSLGTNIKDNGDGSYAVLPPKDKSMDPGTWKWTSTWADNGPMYISDSLKLTLGTDMQDVLTQTKPLDPTLNSIDPNKDVYPGEFIKYSDADNNAMSLVNNDVMNLAMNKFSQWVTKGGINSQWDSYVKQLNSFGLQKNIQTMQKYYDDYESKVSR